MAFKISQNIDECKEQLTHLVEAFTSGYDEYKKGSYSEAQLRIDFLNPFLKSFGWDVNNEARKTQLFREVIQEESIDVEEEDKITKKNPDYTLKQFGQRSLFVEAKKVSIDILSAKAPAFQTRRYGWSANLPFSILTNFEYFVFYDCTIQPEIADSAAKNRFKTFHFEELLDRLDELYDLFSFECIKGGSLDTINTAALKGEDSFDFHFLKQIERWRENLAENLVANNENLSQEEVNFLIQRLINKIIFLRICEDREIEKYETLKNLSNYEELKQVFISSDVKYNSGLFTFIEDDIARHITIDDNVLLDIFSELYYPISPYDYSVIDSDILSRIYEQYLGSKIELASDYSVSIVQEPEVVASNGVVPTPKVIVKKIVGDTLDSLFSTVTYEESLKIKIADICCGSGTFLLSVFDYILHYREEYFLSIDKVDEGCMVESSDGQFRLSLSEKHKILLGNVFGVDVNPYAIEVAQFSLLLRLVEGENMISVQDFIDRSGDKVLPNLDDNIKYGNSLLDEKYFKFNKEAKDNDELLFRLNPFNWIEEFPFLSESGGFNGIVGNPPYVRIQNFIKYSQDEVDFYRSNESDYTYSKKDVFDKYYLFVERAISLLRDDGKLGYIIPHKFFVVKGGKKLRRFITETTSVDRIIHFGVTQVFPNRSTYTAILILTKSDKVQFDFSRIDSLTNKDVFQTAFVTRYRNDEFNSSPWVFVSEKANNLFVRAKSANTIPLNQIAEIPVGLQTSADPIYIFEPSKETGTHFYFVKNNEEFKVEKGICKPALYDVSFDRFDTVEANGQMIFPYDVENDIASVISETDFKTNFPDAWEYLSLFKVKLEKRNINGSNPKWYQYGRSQSLAKFHDSLKIVFPVLSKEPSYIIDETNFQFTGGGNGPYYSITSTSEYSLFYIAAVLSHPVLEAMVKSSASEFKGDYYSHGKQFIENLPIKRIDFENKHDLEIHDEICAIVAAIIAAKQKLIGINIPSKRRVIQRKIQRLNSEMFNLIDSMYGFSEEDLEVVIGETLFAAPIES